MTEVDENSLYFISMGNRLVFNGRGCLVYDICTNQYVTIPLETLERLVTKTKEYLNETTKVLC